MTVVNQKLTATIPERASILTTIRFQCENTKQQDIEIPPTRIWAMFGINDTHEIATTYTGNPRGREAMERIKFH